MDCAAGTLTVTGSTAFKPVLEELGKKYEDECEGGGTSTVQMRGADFGRSPGRTPTRRTRRPPTGGPADPGHARARA
ncbi:hypothetical protein [[Kitasatospora] papulosa]|uniref:hypothetical protein n=1 Tax=[Kitasatospora] papulosa TaxID=1464011 RepID=UPI00368E41C5